MELIIKIDMENASFGETDDERTEEVRRILSQVVNRLGSSLITEIPSAIMDYNGNHIGDIYLHL